MGGGGGGPQAADNLKEATSWKMGDQSHAELLLISLIPVLSISNISTLTLHVALPNPPRFLTD